MLSTRAFQFMGLNAVRCLSVISLILVFASTIAVMVTNIKAVNVFDANNGSLDNDMQDCDYIEGSTVPNQPAGEFWAVVASLLIIFQTIILLLSEIGWPISFFDRFFPVLGSNFGLGALGIFQCLISTQILSHHVDDFTLVSAFFLFAIGCLNMAIGLIFREHAKEKRSISSWRAEKRGILPTAHTGKDVPVFVNATPVYVPRQFTGTSEKSDRPDTAEFGQWRNNGAELKAAYGFGRQGEKAAGLRGFVLQKPEESLPRYAAPSLSGHQKKGSSSLSRNSSVSSSSSSSSFASPYRKSGRSSGGSGVEYADEEEQRAHRDPAVARTPVFRSSPTAL